MQIRFMKRTVLGAVVCALATGAALLGASAAQAAGVPGQGTWETTLQGRDLDGNALNGPEAFYDTTLEITWLRNANANGRMNWNDANAWANSLVVGGIGGWRLPTLVDTGSPGCDLSYAGGTDCGYNVQTRSGGTTYSEMAHLFYVTLGNKAICPPGDVTCSGFPQPGWGLTNTGNFQHMQSDRPYWSGLVYVSDVNDRWIFDTHYGAQGNGFKNNSLYALAVRPGDVAAPVPEPQTLALMLAGLGALLLVRRRWPR